jgi:NAD(P)-dependent dehydrogenase (short-subunit alcohol dehydrogenase family)
VTVTKRVLVIGASRGLGLALADEWARGGWHVTATVRSSDSRDLYDLAERHAGKIEIETVDITVPALISALHDRLAQRMFDLLFVNAGVANQPDGTVAETSTDEFVRVMVTNALGPLRVIEALQDRVEQRARGPRGVPRQQGRPEYLRAELRSTSPRRATELGSDGPGLGEDRARRPTSSAQYRRQHSQRGQDAEHPSG